jgi:hypothetical protein
MKRLLLGLGLGTAMAYGWRRLAGSSPQPPPSWEDTDNDPEDATSFDADLLARTRESPVAQPEEALGTEPAAPPIT